MVSKGGLRRDSQLHPWGSPTRPDGGLVVATLQAVLPGMGRRGAFHPVVRPGLLSGPAFADHAQLERGLRASRYNAARRDLPLTPGPAAGTHANRARSRMDATGARSRLRNFGCVARRGLSLS